MVVPPISSFVAAVQCESGFSRANVRPRAGADVQDGGCRGVETRLDERRVGLTAAGAAFRAAGICTINGALVSQGDARSEWPDFRSLEQNL